MGNINRVAYESSAPIILSFLCRACCDRRWALFLNNVQEQPFLWRPGEWFSFLSYSRTRDYSIEWLHISHCSWCMWDLQVNKDVNYVLFSKWETERGNSAKCVQPDPLRCGRCDEYIIILHYLVKWILSLMLMDVGLQLLSPSWWSRLSW